MNIVDQKGNLYRLLNNKIEEKGYPFSSYSIVKHLSDKHGFFPKNCRGILPTSEILHAVKKGMVFSAVDEKNISRKMNLL